jgi:type I restriction enzyme R subunit
VWHTQGSGKSLTMVMFVKALIEDPHIQNPRVIIVTDRKDLDKQIKDTFKNCNLKKEVIQTKNGEELWRLIASKDLRVITTLIHKFDKISKKKTDFVDNDPNLFVLIDEAHRSQYGDTASRMREVLSHACFIGFTGTPLLKKDKSRLTFGGTIDKYTIDDALRDEIILPLIYEGRYVEMEHHPDQLDRHIDRITEDMMSKQSEKNRDSRYLKQAQKQITADIIKNNPQRIAQIARDIEKHFIATFQHTGLKAQIVAPSKFSAVLFQKFFESHALVQTAVVISDEQDDGDEFDTHKKEVTSYLEKIRHNQSIENYER